METGYLNKYFSGVIVKKLSEVEANIESSNQHELNGNKAMRQILGTDIQRKEFDTIFLYMEDEFDSYCMIISQYCREQQEWIRVSSIEYKKLISRRVGRKK